MTDRAVLDPSVTPAGDANLTELELLAERSGVNLADGHARQPLTAAQEHIVDRMPELFRQAWQAEVPWLDRQAQSSFLCALGQDHALACAQVLSCYSSSVAMEILARSARTAGLRRVGLIHPTFDNIPDILRGVGMELVPISEPTLQAVDTAAVVDLGLDLMFVTTPNNPTGTVLDADQLAGWAAWCAARGVVLALDTSFRGFDPRAMYDHYRILDSSGAQWAVIEDTGKLFPSLDLKAGFLAFPADSRLPLRRIYTDILLGVSPLILRLISELADDAASGGLAALHRAVATNRTALHEVLADTDSARWPDPENRISVERMILPSTLEATAVVRDLRDEGLHVLPCPKFHWADPTAGQRSIRIALGRPESAVRLGADIIRAYLARTPSGDSHRTGPLALATGPGRATVHSG